MFYQKYSRQLVYYTVIKTRAFNCTLIENIFWTNALGINQRFIFIILYYIDGMDVFPNRINFYYHFQHSILELNDENNSLC